MPLVILTGYPCAGKTHRANQIYEDFQSRAQESTAIDTQKRTVTYLPSHHSSLDSKFTAAGADFIVAGSSAPTSSPRDQIYTSSALEKTGRAEEFSAIKRALNKNNVVIADGLNYIKGFRYQLWCEAKAAGTRCVVVHAAAREDECEKWNGERLRQWGWDVADTIDTTEGSVQGPRIGKDVMGDLDPESHTAIYGDRVIFDNVGGSRSRSSSMGGGASDDEDIDEDSQKQRRQLREDTMTLKSLYISDRTSTKPQQISSERLDERQTIAESITVNTPASAIPPSPASALPYSPATLKSLIMRYEPPSPFTRWDTPLFTIPSNDAHPPYTSIWEAIFPPPTRPTSKKALSQLPRNLASTAVTTTRAGSTTDPTNTCDDQNHHHQQPLPASLAGKPDEVRPHAATVLPQATSSEALQTLESSTSDVVKTLLSTAREQNMSNGEGGTLLFHLPLSHNNNNNTAISKIISLSLTLPTNTPLSQPLLQRLRRKYTQIQRGSIAHGRGHAQGREEVIRGFTDFLAAEWSL